MVTSPVFPLKVKSVLFVPVQTVVAPSIVPATDAGSSVTVTVAVELVEQGDVAITV